MIDEDVAQFPNVEKIDNLILVGEKHNCPKSGSLARRVCDGLNPVAFGVEMSPISRRGKINHITARSGAIEYLEGYSSEKGVPLFYLDISQERFSDALEELTPEEMTNFEAKQIANTFEDPVTETGRVTTHSIETARERVKDQINQDVFNLLYTEREQYIAKQLNWMKDEFSGNPVVVAVGAFHVPALKQKLASCDESMSPKEAQESSVN